MTLLCWVEDKFCAGWSSEIVFALRRIASRIGCSVERCTTNDDALLRDRLQGNDERSTDISELVMVIRDGRRKELLRFQEFERCLLRNC